MKALYWIIASFITVAGFGLIAAGAGVLSKDSNKYYDRTETFENISTLDFDIESAEVKLISDPGAKVCTLELRRVPENTTCTQEGETLRVVQESKNRITLFNFDNQDSEIIVTLPEAVYKSIDVKSGSGSITGQDLKSDELKLNTGSGAVKIGNIETDYQDLHTGSGSISLAQVTSRVSRVRTGSGSIKLNEVEISEEASVETGSGSIQGAAVTSDKTSLKTGSGSLKLENVTFTDEVSAVLGSGSVQMSDLTLKADMHLKTGSGGIKLNLLGDKADYVISATLLSGSPDLEGIGEKKNADPYNIVIESGSGSASVHFTAPEAATEAATE